MSVTIRAVQPILGSIVRCFEHAATAVPFATHAEAVASRYERQETPATCTSECIEVSGPAYIEATYPEVLPEVNMSNVHAREVLSALGVDVDAEDWAGAFDASDLEARAMLALAFLPESPALESIEYKAAGGARVVEVGRGAGYVQDRLAEVRTLAVLAAERGYRVTWG